jgi:hypothetical protein
VFVNIRIKTHGGRQVFHNVRMKMFSGDQVFRNVPTKMPMAAIHFVTFVIFFSISTLGISQCLWPEILL